MNKKLPIYYLGTPLLFILMLFTQFVGLAQDGTYTIKGSVIDNSNEPIAGATLLISSDNRYGSVTNTNGEFSFQVPRSAKKMSVSYLGYTSQDVILNGRTVFHIILEQSAEGLDEIQVIAYGTKSKTSITGSVASVQSETLLKNPSASVTNSLMGNMPGIIAVQSVGQPGLDEAELYVRGSSALTDDHDSSPLVLVDGIERSFSQIDPNEIADVTILKDAASTAVFGVRGANGVILVTTKRGEIGKATINISSNISLQAPTRVLEVADSYTQALMWNERKANDGVTSEGSYFSQYALDMYQSGENQIMYPDTDWVDFMFADSYIQTQHNINISGGDEKVRYFTSMGYMFQDGIMNDFDDYLGYDSNFSFNRFNYRANLDIDVTKTTLFKINLGGVVGITKSPNADKFWRQVYWSPSISPTINEDNRAIMLNGGPYLPDSYAMNTVLSKYWGTGNITDSSNTLNFDLQIEQKLDFITEGLKFHVKGSYNSQYDFNVTRSGNLYTVMPYYQGYLDNPTLTDWAADDYNTDIVYQTSGSDTALSYSESTSKSRDWYLEGAVNYSRTFNHKHSVSGLVLYNQSREYYPTINGSEMDYQYIPRSYLGLVGRVSYGYDNKYLVDLNVGYNGSENFASGATRYGLFPSVSVGWVASQEDFIKQIDVISFLKFRVSYGIVGNDKMGTSRFLYMEDQWSIDQTGYNFGLSTTSKEYAAWEDALGNPDISWETAAKQNYGIDLKLFSDKLSVTADYFYEYRTNILITRNTVSGIIGMTLPKLNDGEIENRGFEVELNWRDRTTSGFYYYVTASISRAKNKILYKDEATPVNAFNAETGNSTNLTYGYQFERFYDYSDFYDDGTLKTDIAGENSLLANPQPGDSKYVDLDNNGVLDSNDMTWLGYSTKIPEYTFGLNYGFVYNGFDLSMQWTGVTNVSRNMENDYRYPGAYVGTRAIFQYQVDSRWTPETADTATTPRLSDDHKDYNYLDSSLWVRDASYLRLKNMQLGYTFTEYNWMTNIGLQALNVHFAGYNLITFDSLGFTDPEAPVLGNESANRYPVSKMYTIGIKLTF